MPDILCLAEWDECLGKMIRYHSNISEEIKKLIIQIRCVSKGPRMNYPERLHSKLSSN